MRITARLQQHLSGLIRAEKGVAAVEFALIVPILLLLYLGSIDVSQGVAADRKLAAVAGALGDLVAQNKGSLPSSDLNDYFTASRAIMLPFDGDETPMRVTVVTVNSLGTGQVQRSKGANGASDLAPNAIYELPDAISDLARGGSVVISEAWYNYRPVIGYVLTADIPLYKRNFHIPRFADDAVTLSLN